MPRSKMLSPFLILRLYLLIPLLGVKLAKSCRTAVAVNVIYEE